MAAVRTWRPHRRSLELTIIWILIVVILILLAIYLFRRVL